jgi:hypothetical protein
MLKRSTTHGITGGRWKDSRMRQMIADLVIRGDVVTLETIAGVLLSTLTSTRSDNRSSTSPTMCWH